LNHRVDDRLEKKPSAPIRPPEGESKRDAATGGRISPGWSGGNGDDMARYTKKKEGEKHFGPSIFGRKNPKRKEKRTPTAIG